MNLTPLQKITYGLYVVGCYSDDRPVGCIINTCFQVTSENPVLAISLNKNNFTLDAIRRNPRFSLSILAEDTDPSIIGKFGFCSSRDNDKYSGYGYKDLDGAPAVNGKFCGRLILDALRGEKRCVSGRDERGLGDWFGGQGVGRGLVEGGGKTKRFAGVKGF